jgi:protein involved in ribonucleotide reduction
MLDVVYYSNRSGNTRRFVEKAGIENPIKLSINPKREPIPLATKPYVLFVPTYGGGDGEYAIPRIVARFLNVPENRQLLRGVVGFGNTNFGEHYCKAAYLIAKKTGVPILAKVELLGTPEDVLLVQERMKELNDRLQLS